MALDKGKILTAKATELARSLLVGGARYRRESNLITDLVALLSEVGIDPSDIERKHPAGSAHIDIYAPRYRAIIKTKAQGKAADPNKSQKRAMVFRCRGGLLERKG